MYPNMFACCKSNAAIAEPSPYEAKVASRELTPTDEEETKAEEEPTPLEEPVEEPKEVEVPLEEVEEKSVADDDEAEKSEADAEAEAMTKGYSCCGLTPN